MPLPSLEELWERADRQRAGVGVAVIGPGEPTVVEAIDRATQRGWITARFFDQAPAAVESIQRGEARLLMKGAIDTPSLMRAVLDPARGLRTGRTICQVVLLEVRPAGRRLLLADTGVCIQPTLEQKDDILRHCIEVSHALGQAEAKIAVMAASEKVSESMPETLDAAELSRRRYAGAVVQGPLSFDLAWSAAAGGRKQLEGPVVGAADVMLFPNLVSANLTVKGIMYTADCLFGGVLCGAACPIVFMSRADSTETRLNSLAYALALLPE